MSKTTNLLDLVVPELSDKLIEQLKAEIEKSYEPFIVKIDKNIATAEKKIREIKISAFDLILENPESASVIKKNIEELTAYISKEREKQSVARRKISAIKNLAGK
jgi:predicted AlkP superfamily phosphohydrolase/phosphomutase